LNVCLDASHNEETDYPPLEGINSSARRVDNFHLKKDLEQLVISIDQEDKRNRNR